MNYDTLTTMTLSASLASVATLIASFIGYPLALWIYANLKGTKKKNEGYSQRGEYLPSVTLCVAAYNEEEVIAEKIENSLKLDYPKDRLEIVVFSDSSTDRTDEIVRGFKSQGVQLLSVGGRNGKTHCQNVVTGQARGEIIVYSDANAMYRSDAIRMLVRNFVDPKVGVVVGRRVYGNNPESNNEEGLYERYESLLKDLESSAGGTIGANGSIYALRKDLYIDLDKKRISDITEPLLIAARHKKKVIHEGKAISVEHHDNTAMKELGRKRRIVLRTLNSMWAIRVDLMKNPSLLFKLLFHKMIKWGTLPLLLIIVVCGLFSRSIIGQVASTAAGAYILTGTLLLLDAAVRKEERRLIKPLRVALYSFIMFLASVWAAIGFLQGQQKTVWESRQ